MSKKWECEACGFVYDEEKGLTRDNIPAHTSFDEIHEGWVCPDCQVGKEYFQEITH